MPFSLQHLSVVCLALAATISATPLSTERVTRQATTCATGLHLMIGGGCDMPCAANVPSYLNTTLATIHAAFPNSDEYYVPYDNSMKQAADSTPLMIAAAQQYVAQCPNTPIVFVGYSLGGIIIMSTLCGGLGAQYIPNVLAAIAYGEETWTYPQTYDYGTCKANSPKARANTAGCANSGFAPAIRSYCDAADSACCLGGTNIAEHFTYPVKYNADVTEFIKARYVSRYGSIPVATATVSSSSVDSAAATGGSSYNTALVSVSTAAASTTSASAVISSTTITSSSMASSTSASITTGTTTKTTTTTSTTSPSLVASYTGAANILHSTSYIQAFVAVAVCALLR